MRAADAGDDRLRTALQIWGLVRAALRGAVLDDNRTSPC